MNSKDLATRKAPAKAVPSSAREGGDSVAVPGLASEGGDSVAFDQHHDMAGTYLKPRAVLLLRNPEWMFLHWDFDGSTEERLTAGGEDPLLRVLQNGSEVLRTAVDLGSRRYYIKIPDGGGAIQAQLGRDGAGEFLPILSSETVAAPAARISDDLTVRLAAPAWTGATRETLVGNQILTEAEYRSLFGEVPNDVPWYRRSTR